MNMDTILKNIKCQFQNHQQHQIMAVCLNKDCKFQRLCCRQCIGAFHTSHASDLVAIDSFNSFIQQESNKQAQFPQSYSYCNSQLIKGLEELLIQIESLSKIINNQILQLRKQNIQEYLNKQGESQSGIEYWNEFIKDLLQYVDVKDCLLILKSQNQYTLNVLEKQILSKIFQLNDDLKNMFKQFVTPIQSKQLRFQSNPIRLQGHEHAVNGVAISSDGAMIASGSNDNTVKLWNVQTKELMKTFQYNGIVYGGVAFSSNNQYLAYGGDGDYSIQLQDLKQNNNCTKLKGHNYIILAIVFSSDSQFLYSGGYDKKLIVWNISSYTQINRFDTDSAIYKIVNSLDNNLISCICTRSINIWDYSTKTKLIYQQDPHYPNGFGLCASKDSSMFISSGQDGLIKIWMLSDCEKNQKSLKLTREIKASDKQIWNVILTSDEDYIISICNQLSKIMIHDIKSGNIIQQLQYGDGKAKYSNGYISLSSDMKVLALGGEDKMTKIWIRE